MWTVLEQGVWTNNKENHRDFLMALYHSCKAGACVPAYGALLERLGYQLPTKQYVQLTPAIVEQLLNTPTHNRKGLFLFKQQCFERYQQFSKRETPIGTLSRYPLVIDYPALLKTIVHGSRFWQQHYASAADKAGAERLLKSTLFGKCLAALHALKDTSTVAAEGFKFICDHKDDFTSIVNMATYGAKMSPVFKDRIASKKELFSKVYRLLLDINHRDVLGWRFYCLETFLDDLEGSVSPTSVTAPAKKMLRALLGSPDFYEAFLYAGMLAVSDWQLFTHSNLLFSVYDYLSTHPEVSEAQALQECTKMLFDLTNTLPNFLSSATELRVRFEKRVTLVLQEYLADPGVPLFKRKDLYDALALLEVVKPQDVLKKHYVLASGRIIKSEDLGAVFASLEDLRARVLGGGSVEALYYSLFSQNTLGHIPVMKEDFRAWLLNLLVELKVNTENVKEVYVRHIANPYPRQPLASFIGNEEYAQNHTAYVVENHLRSVLWQMLSDFPLLRTEKGIKEIIDNFRREKAINYNEVDRQECIQSLQAWVNDFIQSRQGALTLTDESELRGELNLYFASNYLEEPLLTENIYEPKVRACIQKVSEVYPRYVENELQRALYARYQEAGALKESVDLQREAARLKTKVRFEVEHFLASLDQAALTVTELPQLIEKLFLFVRPLVNPAPVAPVAFTRSEGQNNALADSMMNRAATEFIVAKKRKHADI